jgi:hypothetical protein
MKGTTVLRFTRHPKRNQPGDINVAEYKSLALLLITRAVLQGKGQEAIDALTRIVTVKEGR